jgi:hypothetical protein
MSHYVYFCELPWECKILPTGNDCATCQNLDFAERVADVYRPHRRAVVQSMKLRRVPGMGDGYRVVAREARLGCPDARAWVRRRRRVANGTRMGRWSWSWSPRGHQIPNELPLGRVHVLSGRV